MKEISLNLELTPELVLERFEREVIHAVNRWRKENNYDKELGTIYCKWTTYEEAKEISDTHNRRILKKYGSYWT